MRMGVCVCVCFFCMLCFITEDGVVNSTFPLLQPGSGFLFRLLKIRDTSLWAILILQHIRQLCVCFLRVYLLSKTLTADMLLRAILETSLKSDSDWATNQCNS